MNFLENILGKDNSFWKYIVIFLLSFLASALGNIPLIVVVMIKVLSQYDMSTVDSTELSNQFNELFKTMDFSSIGISSNLTLALILFSFVVGLVTAWLLVRSMHKRNFCEVVNGTNSIRWKRVFSGFGFWFLLMFISLGINYVITPDNFTLRFDVETFISLLIISLCLIPLQTTFEEFLFRGYLTQGVAGWTKSRWLAICIPALLFGLLHSGNKEVAEYGFWTAMPLYILPGLIFGFVAVMDDGIELPMGMHAANNIFASVFVTFEASSLHTQALITQETVYPNIDIIVLLIIGVITIYVFSKLYKWDFRDLFKNLKI